MFMSVSTRCKWNTLRSAEQSRTGKREGRLFQVSRGLFSCHHFYFTG